MENSELKKAHWRKIKKDFISKIPKRFNLDIEGLEDESEYYHPIIILDDELIIRGQCSLGFEDVYALSIHFKTKAEIGSYLYKAELGIDDDKLPYLLTGLANVQTIRTAEMSDICCIVFVRNKKVNADMVKLGEESGMVLIECPCSMFKASGLLYNQGLKPVF